MTTPADIADDNHGRVARYVSIALVSLYSLVALGWALTVPDAKAVAEPAGIHAQATK